MNPDTPTRLIALGVSILVGIAIVMAITGLRWLLAIHRERRAYQAATGQTHQGATEAYGAELAATGQTLPSADLRTTAEQMLADHTELDSIGAALTQFGEAIDHHLRLFTQGLTGRQQLHISRVSTTTGATTGTFNRRELDAMLAQQPKLTNDEIAAACAELAGAGAR